MSFPSRSSGTPSTVRFFSDAACLQQGQLGIGVGIRDMDGFASEHHTADDRRPIRCDWMTLHDVRRASSESRSWRRYGRARPGQA